MKKNTLLPLGGLIVSIGLTACGFVSGQLADKAREEQLLKPGALDVRLTSIYDTYQFKFLDNHRVTHEWPRNSNGCRYSGLPTLNVKDGFRGELYAIDDIYEDGNSTKQRGAHPSFDFDRFVRSNKEMRPIYAKGVDKNGNTFIYAGKVAGYEEREQGLKPVCFEAWVGTSHSLALRLYKSPMPERMKHYEAKSGTSSNKKVGGNTWWVRQYPFGPDMPDIYGGEAWVTPVGDTGYTLALELGAGALALKNPQAHANFQAMFRHLIESVKIEPLNAQLEAELAELAKKAHAAARIDCEAMTKRTKPSRACKELLEQPSD
jgi:hypothetical protein